MLNLDEKWQILNLREKWNFYIIPILLCILSINDDYCID